MIASFANARVVILADKNERRQENRLKRDDQCQESEGEGIDVLHTGKNVEHDPPAKPDNVNPDKGHAAAEIGYLLCDAVGGGPFLLCSFLEFLHHLDVSLRKVIDRSVMNAVFGCSSHVMYG